MLGYAWQKGLLPLTGQAILRAIELNEVSVDSNKAAFAWGRYAAHDLAAVEELVAPDAGAKARGQHSATLQQLVDKRVALLTAYQDAAYAKRYAALVERVRGAESANCGAVAMDAALDGSTLTEAVARYYAKLLAYKDEYEVARLYTDGGFEAKVAAMFEGDVSLKFHLAPPVFNRPDPVTGVARKSQFGPWMMGAFRVLAKLRFLRGGPLDIFGRTGERRMERRLIADYERNVGLLLGSLTPANRALAVQIASLPEQVRGFGHVKLKHLGQVRERGTALLAQWQSPSTASVTKAA
jgi:indolepyruvate ferredoxin oxidoreductase